MFFFEKKNQKTFVTLLLHQLMCRPLHAAIEPLNGTCEQDKSFLVFSFKKEHAAFPSRRCT